jgi:hypothetical protein
MPLLHAITPHRVIGVSTPFERAGSLQCSRVRLNMIPRTYVPLLDLKPHEEGRHNTASVHEINAATGISDCEQLSFFSEITPEPLSFLNTCSLTDTQTSSTLIILDWF